MNWRNLSFFLVIFIFFLKAECSPPDLSPHSTKKKTEKIFRAHVAHKEFNQEIIQRTLQNFIDELDPTKTYFLYNEIVTWDSPSFEMLSRTSEEYKKEQFTTFEAIYAIMIKAINRRDLIEGEINESPLPENVLVSDFKDLKWCKTEEDLQNRLLRLRSLQLDAADKLDQETRDQFLGRLNKRRSNHHEELTGGSLGDQKTHVLAYFLKAFTAALDSHTSYFTPSEASQFMIQVQQRLFGIGAQLRDDLNGFTLIRILDDSPALVDNKLKVGDRIIAVNSEPVVGMDILEAVQLIRGPQGTSVKLTVLRESGEAPDTKLNRLDVDIVRDEIVLKETRFETHQDPFGDGIIAHIKLFSFYQDPTYSSSADIKKELKKLKENNNLLGVILDLRNNAGGVLPQAVSVTGLFIKKGIVVSIKDNNGSIQHLRNFEEEQVWDGPLIVLTNRASASAAEIVAQTLQDYGRALLVGDDRTFGKGSYQTFTLETGANAKVNPQGEYKVTRGLYYTVSGNSPQLSGTAVDVTVPGVLSQLDVGESFAKFPIENDTISSNYIDTLSDVHPFHRGKFLRLYKHDRQEKMDLYSKYVSTISKNSDDRIKESNNYQNFLKEIQKEKFDIENVEQYGQNDIQFEETLFIMKDLLYLSGWKPEASMAAG